MLKKITQNNLAKSKLTQLLAVLDVQSVKQFKAWFKLQGSTKRDAFLVLNYLLLYHPYFDSPKLEQTIAFKRIFGKLPFNYRRLMKAVSQVHLELKQYLVQQSLSTDPFLQDYLLAKIYTKYNLVHERTLLVNKQLKREKKAQHTNEFWMELQWHDFSFFSEKKLHNQNQNQQQGVLKADKALDWYYLGKKLKYACEIASQEKLYNLKYTIQLIDPIIAFCQTHYTTLPLYHQLFFSLYQFIKAPSLVSYYALKKLFENNYQHFEQPDQLFILIQLTNFMTNQLSKKVDNALEELFELYKFGIEKVIFVLDESFVNIRFINLIAICSALEKFVWIDKILANQLGTLAKNHDISTYSIAMARLSFAKKDFSTCIAYLIEVDYSIFVHSKHARIYQIACAYELNELPHIIESHCKSFENYLRRHADIYLTSIQANLNFIYLVRKLNRHTPNKNNLKQLFKALSPIAFHKWLQEKIDQLP